MRGRGGSPPPCRQSHAWGVRFCRRGFVLHLQRRKKEQKNLQRAVVRFADSWCGCRSRESEVSGLHSEKKGSSRATITQARPAHALQSNRALPHPVLPERISSCHQSVQKCIVITQTTALGASSSQGDNTGGDATPERSLAGTV